MTEKQPKNNNEPKKPKQKKGFALHPELINKNGRPPKGTAITDLLEEYLDDVDKKDKKTRKQILIEKIYKMATKDGDLAALKYIVDRIDGKPKDRVETDNNTDLNIKIEWK